MSIYVYITIKVFIYIYIIMPLSVCQIHQQQRPRKLDIDETLWCDVIKEGVNSKFDILAL